VRAAERAAGPGGTADLETEMDTFIFVLPFMSDVARPQWRRHGRREATAAAASELRTLLAPLPRPSQRASVHVQPRAGRVT
jgi:hypothetical protein